jgi:hypothetical protein
MAKKIDILLIVKGSDRLNQEKKEIKLVLRSLAHSLTKIGRDALQTIVDEINVGRVRSLRPKAIKKTVFTVGSGMETLTMVATCWIDSTGIDLHEARFALFCDTEESSGLFSEGYYSDRLGSINDPEIEAVSWIHALLPQLADVVLSICPLSNEHIETLYAAARRADLQ